MPSKDSFLFRCGTLALALCAVLNAGTHRRSNSGTHPHGANYCSSCVRDSQGRIARDPAQVRAFRSSHPCPATGSFRGTCPGYVVDHIKALKHRGSDAPKNMQWPTRAEAKAKDRDD
jgi:hypothetical protein